MNTLELDLREVNEALLISSVRQHALAAQAQQAEALMSCQKQAFEMVALGTPLMEVLEFLVRSVESQSPQQALAAIHLLDESGMRFEQTIAPSLPASYRQAVDGMAWSPVIGSCSAAIARRRRVVVPDIAAAKEWRAFAAFTLPLGLRAAASTPIFSSDKVVGSFVTYYREVRKLEPQDELLDEIVTRTATIVIERKEAEDKLHESETRYRRLFESSQDGILILDAARGTVIDANPFMSQLLGCSHEDLQGKELWQIGLFADKARSEAAMRELQEKGYLRYEDLPLETNRGPPVEVEVVANAYREDDQNVIQCNVRDISERSRLEKITLEQATALADLHRRKDEFLAMLSHELRNPLAPILNAVQLLRLDQKGSERQQRARAIIERQVGQLARLVDDLLEVSRISTGRVHLHEEQVDLRCVVERALETVRPLVGQQRHVLSVALPPSPVWAQADSTRIEQVVVNLLNNAVKYTPEGGEIWVELQQQDDEAVLRVRDTGEGIAPEVLPRIFDLFTQSERSLDRSGGGLGIGLALVQKLVEMHHGRVEAHSTLGRGSEFVVHLPILLAALPQSPAPADKPDSVSLALRVLVVDDNVDAAYAWEMLLKKSGHDTRLAHTGPAALQEADAFQPHVVLLDIGLPQLDGYEVAKRLRQHATLKNITLVAMTGYGQESDRQLSKDAGFDHHLVKPADFGTLKRILAGVSEKAN